MYFRLIFFKHELKSILGYVSTDFDIVLCGNFYLVSFQKSKKKKKILLWILGLDFA